MVWLNVVAQSKLKKLGPQNPTATDMQNGKGEAPRRNVDKELPLNPDEQAGLREHRRAYTRELLADRKPEIDPNHAYPTRDQSTTLILSMSLSPLNC